MANDKPPLFSFDLGGISNIVIIIVAVVFVILYINSCSDKETLEKILRQNELAYNDSLKVLMYENELLYHKYAMVGSLKDSLTDIMKNNNEKILTLSKQMIYLQHIIKQGFGAYDSTTNVPVTPCLGLKMNFVDSNAFYSLAFTVTVDTPKPKFDFQQKFNPFSITNYLTRNKDGIWSSYVKVDEAFNEFIKIGDVKTIIDKDEYIDVENNDKSLSFIPTIGFGIYNDGIVKTDIGLTGLIDKYLIGYSKGIGNSFHFVKFGYLISFN